jgi:hypothetical protein
MMQGGKPLERSSRPDEKRLPRLSNLSTIIPAKLI